MSETIALPFISVGGEEGLCHGDDRCSWFGLPAGVRPGTSVAIPRE
jgi:hypothetical protein